jgi:hypothetical protein
VDGSRTIRVCKRDGSDELFCAPKLAAGMARAMRETSGRYFDACQLALAVELYLDRNNRRRVSSTALFEMVVKVLHRAGLVRAADAMETCRAARAEARRHLCICHDGGQSTQWDKGWLSQLAQRSWFLSPVTARILAGEVERELLSRGPGVVARRDVLDMLNQRVAEYGLADAVPVQAPVGG